MTNDGGNAFPVGGGDQRNAGMTLRDYFAAAALQGLSALEDNRTLPKQRTDVDAWRKETAEEDARWCYVMADAMLKAREVSGD